MTALLVENLNVKRGLKFELQVHKLAINRGLVIGVTGPNGSGKTTLLEAMVSLDGVTQGKISLQGIPISTKLYPIRSHLGYIPDDEDWFVAELTAREYFDLLISIYQKAGVVSNMQRTITRLSKELNFVQFDQTLNSLSHGNKRKVQLIAGIMHQPAVIIIDELRNGLDPMAVIAAERIIKLEAERGAAIIAATHDLWWAERMADEIILLNNGQIILQAKTKQLLKKHDSLESLFIDTIGRGDSK